MTYSSRNFLISWGVGRDDRVPRFSNRLSSAMMSLQTSTHSSQMNTVGPAISFRTSFWSLLQNEHRKTRSRRTFSPFLVHHGLGPLADDVINNTVFLALVGRHDVVALCVVLDTLFGLPGVIDQDGVD